MIQEAIILAGGLGTRLRAVVDDLPKSMAPVNGRPFLEYQLDYLQSCGVSRVVLSVGYMHEAITAHFGARYGNIDIDYVVEEEPLGTGGGLLLAMQKASAGTVLALNGDTMFKINLQRILTVHRSKESKLSIVLRQVDDVSRFGAIEISQDKSITGFWEKAAKKGEGLINGGAYIINRKFFLDQHLPQKFSLEKDFFEKIYHSQKIYGILCRQYFLDIGVPDDYSRAQHDFKSFDHI